MEPPTNMTLLSSTLWTEFGLKVEGSLSPGSSPTYDHPGDPDEILDTSITSIVLLKRRFDREAGKMVDEEHALPLTSMDAFKSALLDLLDEEICEELGQNIPEPEYEREP